MSFISNIVSKVSNLWNVQRHFVPFLKSLENKLNSIQLIDLKIDSTVKEIYDTLAKSSNEKNKKYVEEYNSLIAKVGPHNEKVTSIDERMLSFNLFEILAEPQYFDINTIVFYTEVVDEIKSFKTYNLIYSKFCEDVLNVEKYYQDIIKQKELLDNYKKEVDDFKELNIYIDSNLSKDITKRLTEIQNNFMMFEKKFYDFTFFDVSSYVKQHNKNFIDENINNPMFDSVNGRCLDKDQRTAVLTDETSTLVVAGAGSGKTLTICAKVKYLVEERGIDPSQILLLSYSKKSAEDLQEKISKINDGFIVGTFHKIGLEILKTKHNKTFMVEDQFNAIIEKYFREEVLKRPKLRSIILNYYAMYNGNDTADTQYEDVGELYESLKKDELETLKNSVADFKDHKNKYSTLKKEKVKSFEEFAIANWYFLHGIEYEYERPYEKDVSTEDKRQYMPDFYLPKYKIYHEHYGIDKNGYATQFKGEEAQNYVSGMQWKREIHKTNGTICYESYSYQNSDHTLFQKLEEFLKAHGVEFNTLSESEFSDVYNSVYEGLSFKSFINLVKSFINLYKAKYTDDSGFKILAKGNIENFFFYEKSRRFLYIARDIYNYYMDTIRNNNKIDFDDMILQSNNVLDELRGYKYKYIIVDEFQDISYSRMLFLKKLISHGNSKLFAVGDDWQAIYRFSGCDLNIFLEFQKYFGTAAIVKITSTHRHSKELQNIAGSFVKMNPKQFKKTISSNKSLNFPVRLMYYQGDKIQKLLKVFDFIKTLDRNANVLLLGRNNKDLDSVLYPSILEVKNRSNDEGKLELRSKDFPEFNISYSTVHSSKGLEEDYVVLINAEDKKLGFPNKIEDDELLNLVLSERDTFNFAEERRLFYVALTRTRTYTFILVDKNNPSIFIKDIKPQCAIMNEEVILDDERIIKCPYCKSGNLLLNQNKKGIFYYSCSNNPYCDYYNKNVKSIQFGRRCPSCGDFLTIRKGPSGAFLGCHRYPRCEYTQNIIKGSNLHLKLSEFFKKMRDY